MEDLSKIILNAQVQRIDRRPVTVPSAQPKTSGPSFDKILESEIKVSKHAEKRLVSRNLSLGESHLAGLDQALESLNKKGARDSLVVMNELALVVNVPSRTVVTAIAKDQMKEQVFTNIDSTIFVNA